MKRRLLPSVLALSATAVAACGPKEPGPCTEERACPVVDRDPGPGDYRVSLGKGGGTIDLQQPGADPESRINEFDLVGAEIVFGAPSCVEGECRATLERLRFELPQFDVSFTDGRDAQYRDTTLSFQTPIEMQSDGVGEYVLPAGSVLHTCTSIDDHPWHDVAPLPFDALIRIDVVRRILAVRARFYLAIRAVDMNCSQSSLEASLDLALDDWTAVPDDADAAAASPDADAAAASPDADADAADTGL